VSENGKLDRIHHVAINVADVDQAVKWYQSSFNCGLLFKNNVAASLEFENLRLTLVLPSQQPPHLCFLREDASAFGELLLQPDGVKSTFLADPTGNLVELTANDLESETGRD
jgi:catechol 2,3-dioxygenase-like lactoylglutathione lyase family enzyme